MKKVLDYADIFYQKRFILEKENRLMAFSSNSDLIIEAEVIGEETP